MPWSNKGSLQGPAGQAGQTGPAGSFPSVRFALAANVTLTPANTHVPVLNTGVLAAGTWFVTAQVTVGRAATGATNYTARLWNGTTNYASAQVNVPSLNPHVVTLPLLVIVVLAAPATITLTVAASVVSSLVYAAATANVAGTTATQLSAIKIA